MLLSSVVVVVVVVEDYRPMGFTPLQKLFIGPQSLPFYDIHLALNIDIHNILFNIL